MTDDVIDYRRWIQCNFPLSVGPANGRFCPSVLETCDLSGSPSPPEERKSSKARVWWPTNNDENQILESKPINEDEHKTKIYLMDHKICAPWIICLPLFYHGAVVNSPLFVFLPFSSSCPFWCKLWTKQNYDCCSVLFTSGILKYTAPLNLFSSIINVSQQPLRDLIILLICSLYCLSVCSCRWIDFNFDNQKAR